MIVKATGETLGAAREEVSEAIMEASGEEAGASQGDRQGCGRVRKRPQRNVH